LVNWLNADWVTAVSTAIMAVTGVAALFYAARQLNQSRDLAKVQHLLDFVKQFNAEPMIRLRKSVAEQRLRGVTEPEGMDDILNFFETIGLLVRRDYLDAEDVWDSFSYWMFNVYVDFREYIEHEQKNDYTYYSDFCDLVNEDLIPIEKDLAGQAYPPSPERVTEFWKEEANIFVGKPAPKRGQRRKPQAKKKATSST